MQAGERQMGITLYSRLSATLQLGTYAAVQRFLADWHC